MKNDVPQIPSTVAMILMVISVATFAFFEVYKMAFIQNRLQGLIGLLQNPGGQYPLPVMIERLNELENKNRELSLSFYKVWRTVLPVTVATGGLAVFIFFGTLLYHLGTLLLVAIRATL
jgi:hypothetical protein